MQDPNRGIGCVHGRAIAPIVTTSDQAARMYEEDLPYILVVPTTSAEHVVWVAKSVGVVTQQGGILSHAAITARHWQKPCVCGVLNIEFNDYGILLGSTPLRWGVDPLMIDGGTGEVIPALEEA